MKLCTAYTILEIQSGQEQQISNTIQGLHHTGPSINKALGCKSHGGWDANRTAKHEYTHLHTSEKRLEPWKTCFSL
jgi:hypothetical protein